MFWSSLEADPPQTASTWTANATLHADPTRGLCAKALINPDGWAGGSTDDNVVQIATPKHPLLRRTL